MDTVRATAKNSNQRSIEVKTPKFQKHAQGADPEAEARRQSHTHTHTHTHRRNRKDLPVILHWKQQKVKRSSKKADRLQRKHEESTL